MAESSPPRSHLYSSQWASPGQRSTASDFLYEDRNSEARHKALLEKARREHERVRKNAEAEYQDYLRREEQRRLEEERSREEERIRREEQLAAERRRLAELKAKKVEIPSEPVSEPPKASPQQTKAAVLPATASQPSQPTSTSTPRRAPVTQSGGTSTPALTPVKPAAASTAIAKPSPATPAGNPFASAAKANPWATSTKPPSSSPFAQGAQQQSPFAAASKEAKPNPFATTSTTTTPQTNGIAVAQSAATPAPRLPTAPDRYQTIHKNLKDLRKSMLAQTKTNPALKARMGDMRREVRKCVGQLVNGAPGAGQNKTQILNIKGLLREALLNGAQSQLVDPSLVVLEPREPVEGAVHNDPQLPSIFLYMLNIFAKAIISQFVNEASAKPDTADAVGVVAASVFADREFQWRGKSLIDILLAKFRVVCPVVFGHFGNEKFEEGRRQLGWHREGDQWVSEQQHSDRMTGLGAGYAAIALRNFSKSKMSHPFPPSNYWTAMARIINTAPPDISNTQAMVLRAMIQGSEHKFLEAYGNAGLAALRLALVEFPAKAPTKSPYINALAMHAQMLAKETGLRLM
ncbi:hypothetical protein DL546_004629 [Coniochaeta pulveracea]|uniref:mRNA export factor GLE1 n=1 Tax=Coniochaeta pulveracea TaxID=177199 RepID=A0A420Y2G8_9PEZI|nr:hypothetical protein DL546_004629 [Coniochaeta pulveracea]